MALAIAIAIAIVIVIAIAFAFAIAVYVMLLNDSPRTRCKSHCLLFKSFKINFDSIYSS